MKQMKIFIAALCMVLMGTTFTSCLNSDGEMTYSAVVTIIESGYGVSVKSDDGLILNVQNPSTMQLKDKDGLAYYPERALIYYTLFEGEVLAKEKTEYKVLFSNYYAVYTTNNFSYESVISGTPIRQLGYTWGANGYFNIPFEFYYNSETKLTDYTMFAEKAEGTTLYCKLVQTQKLNNPSDYNAMTYSYRIPYKSNLATQFPELKFFGQYNDSIQIIVTAEGSSGSKLETSATKIKLK